MQSDRRRPVETRLEARESRKLHCFEDQLCRCSSPWCAANVAVLHAD